MGNAAVSGPDEHADPTLCMTPTCRIFGAQMARQFSSCDLDCSTITVRLDTETSDSAVWPQSPEACLAPLQPLVKTLSQEPLVKALSQEPAVAGRHSHELQHLPRLLAREDGPIPRASGGIPRSLTRGLDGDGCEKMREAASEAARAAIVAEAERRMREEKLRRELDEGRAEEVKRRAEVEAERRRREEAACQRRKARDEIARATIARNAKEEREACEKVDQFLSSRGFRGARDGRRRLFRTCYPLHVAVALNDAEMVKLLLQAGADPSQRDSSRRTPQILARKCNKGGSHEKVLSMLAAL